MAPCRVEVLCMASQIVAVVAMEEDILSVWWCCGAGRLLVVVERALLICSWEQCARVLYAGV